VAENGTAYACSDLSSYCGGTWLGIRDNLDYISGMGFDAIWISPVVANTPGGYHGYWASNLSALNANFGTSEDLVDLVKSAHQKGMWVMVDVVANHMGGSIDDIGSYWPFNQGYHYHDCSGCPSDCGISNFDGGFEEEHCRLAGLPDLDQDQQYVADQLRNWVASLVRTYGFDGIRVDTVPEVKSAFWKTFNSAADVYAVGEVFNGDVNFVGPYQGAALDAVLSYPMFYTLRQVFGSQYDFSSLQSMVQQYPQHFLNPALLGTFVDNHDQERFLHVQSDRARYKNALTFVLLSTGIPIVYYGTEQAYTGGDDPSNRESLWQSGYNTSSEIYQFIVAVNNVRHEVSPWTLEREIWLLADAQCGAFHRGSSIILAMTNAGEDSGLQSRVLRVGSFAADGTTFCDALTSICREVGNSQLNIQFRDGMPLILIKKQQGRP
jgi:alpha-amylase